jgi:hypothetical protein
MTEATAIVSVVDNDPSLREALQSLIRSIGLRVATSGSTQGILTGNRPNAPADQSQIVIPHPYLVSLPLHFLTKLATNPATIPS